MEKDLGRKAEIKANGTGKRKEKKMECEDEIKNGKQAKRHSKLEMKLMRMFEKPIKINWNRLKRKNGWLKTFKMRMHDKLT